LSYQICGSFRIVQCTERGSYLIKKLNNPPKPELKFMATYLYPFPPSFNSCEPVDGSDIKYVNQSSSTISNPQSKSMNIIFYNKYGSINHFEHLNRSLTINIPLFISLNLLLSYLICILKSKPFHHHL